MNPKIKIAIRLGVGLGVGFLIFRFVRSQISKKGVLRQFGQFKTIKQDNKGNVGGFEISGVEGFNARPHAQSLYTAMSGWGTDEDMIFDTLDPLTKEQAKAVRTYFNTYFSEGYSLDQWFEGDLSGSDLTRARGYFY